jgi:hypothetical protein
MDMQMPNGAMILRKGMVFPSIRDVAVHRSAEWEETVERFQMFGLISGA